LARLNGKVAMVTGSTRGIGRAVALAYAKEGAKVACCGRRQTDLEKVVAEIRAQGGMAGGFAAELLHAHDRERLVAQVAGDYERIDVLVNNASVLGPRVALVDYPLEDWQEVLSVNLTAPFDLARRVACMMMRERTGSIINVSSGVGKMGRAAWGAYSVSKFGIEGLTQVLAAELKDFEVRVNALNPGGTRTSMRAQAYPEEDPFTLPEPSDIVEAFIYLASDESSHVTGQSLDARDWTKGSA